MGWEAFNIILVEGRPQDVAEFLDRCPILWESAFQSHLKVVYSVGTISTLHSLACEALGVHSVDVRHTSPTLQNKILIMSKQIKEDWCTLAGHRFVRPSQTKDGWFSVLICGIFNKALLYNCECSRCSVILAARDLPAIRLGGISQTRWDGSYPVGWCVRHPLDAQETSLPSFEITLDQEYSEALIPSPSPASYPQLWTPWFPFLWKAWLLFHEDFDQPPTPTVSSFLSSRGFTPFSKTGQACTFDLLLQASDLQFVSDSYDGSFHDWLDLIPEENSQ